MTENMKKHIGKVLSTTIIVSNHTQRELSELTGVSQPRLSDLANGKYEKFSLDMMIQILNKLGYEFEYNIKFTDDVQKITDNSTFLKKHLHNFVQ